MADISAIVVAQPVDEVFGTARYNAVEPNRRIELTAYVGSLAIPASFSLWIESPGETREDRP